MTKLILTAVIVVGSIALWFLKNYFSAEQKRKKDAKAKFDKAIDSGNRIDVLDSFNEPD